MIEYGVNTYSEITPERIKQMTIHFSIKKFFSEEYRGIAVVIITPKQYLAIYSKEDNKELNHDKFIDMCMEYIYEGGRNPSIIIELTHTQSLDQCIIQLPQRKITPISNKMNRLKLYFEKIIRYYQPNDIQSDSSKDFIFVKKIEALTCKEERILGIDIDKANKALRLICQKIHIMRGQGLNGKELKNDLYNR